MEKDSNEVELLTEEQFRAISKQIKTFVPTGGAAEPTEDEIKSLGELFEQTFYAASKPNLPPTHRVASWNVLCGLIDQSVSSESEQIRSLIWSSDIWDRSFDLYLSQGQNARPKSSKQLLATLSAAVRRNETGDDLKYKIAEQLLAGVKREDNHGRTKSSLQALAFFLGRDVLFLDHVIASIRKVSDQLHPRTSRSNIAGLLSLLLGWVGRCEFGSTIGQAVSVVLDKADQARADGDGSLPPIWMESLEYALSHNEGSFDDFRIHIFPVVFRRRLSDYALFLERHGLQELASGGRSKDGYSSQEFGQNDYVFYSALASGKDVGLLEETEESEIRRNEQSILFPVRHIERLLYSSSRNARLTGLSLLITSRSMTKPVPSQTFRILKRRLSIFFADTDANFRGEVFSLVQKLIDRMRATTAVLGRHAKVDPTSETALLEHIAFLEWLIQFLSWELRPTASYQRHISALKSLLVVIKSGVDESVPSGLLSKSALNETKWPFSVQIMNRNLWRQLLDLLMDPFEDVRQLSAAVLTIYAVSESRTAESDCSLEIAGTLRRAESTMLATGRADHADGVAHMYQLLSCLSSNTLEESDTDDHSRQSIATQLVESLEQMLETAKSSLSVAANKYPIHGLLTSIRYAIVQDPGVYGADPILTRLSNCLHQVWNTVKPVLCNDAPEGYMPEDIDETQDISTKDTLSYCWRALKESSLLLGVIVNQKLLNEDQIMDLSNLCFAQLAELRHRGAFSTVAQTWITCCMRCRDFKLDGKKMLEVWYTRVLDSLENKTTINTRRSAGLPSLICGLLIADQTGSSTSQAIRDLTTIARQSVHSESTNESSLPQVHALNCIKDILKNTRLSEHSERYISHAFLLAADSLQSEAWAVRNCGLMLFRAAIDRLLGTSESHLDEETNPRRKISLLRQPELIDAVFALLRPSEAPKSSAGSGGSEGVFPALQLLQRVQIPDGKMADALSAVFHLSSSSSWHVRDKAARTFAAIIDAERIEVEIDRLLSSRLSGLNAQHGTLLCAKYLVIRLSQISPSPSRTAKDLMIERSHRPTSGNVLSHLRAASDFYLHNTCPLIQSAYLDILLSHLQYKAKNTPQNSHRQNQQTMDLDFIDSIRDRSLDNGGSRSGPGAGALRQTASRLLAHYLHSIDGSDQREVFDLVLKIAESDADACSSLFKELRPLGQGSTVKAQSSLCAMLEISRSILSSSYDTGLKCEVQRFLLSCADLQSFDKDLSILFVDVCNTASSPLSQSANHIYADQWLQLEAIKLEQCVRSTAELTDQALASFVFSCKLAIQDEQSGIFSREAAVHALDRIDILWIHLNVHHEHDFQVLCFGVYDLLNDDDEEIRLMAVTTTARILKSGKNELHDRAAREPISASQCLITFMLKRWSTDLEFAMEALDRAFGLSSSGHIESVADKLDAYSNVDTALFVEEKQNLYIDEAREARLWSQVVFSLHPVSIPLALVRQLAGWVSEGLDTLKRKVECDGDGPLGWTTKADVFRLGVQVVYGVETLLRLVERGIRLPVRPSDLRLRLGILVDMGRAKGINGLWLRETERVEIWALRSRLRFECGRLKRVMNTLVDVR